MRSFIIANTCITIFLAIVVFLFMFTSLLDGCSNKKGGFPPTRDTVVSVVYVKQPERIDSAIHPEIKITVNPTVVPSKYIIDRYQGNEKMEELIEKIIRIEQKYDSVVKEHIATNKYENVINLKDSSGIDVGVVNLDQSVTENKLDSFRPRYTLKFPSTTTTITIKEKYIPRNQLYYGFEGGVRGKQFTDILGQLAFKNKKDLMLQIGAGIDIKTLTPLYKAGVLKKFQLKGG